MSSTVVALENATIQNENKVIFKALNFKIYAGDFVFLIGKTGAGKSSLLKVLYGDLPLSQGEGNCVGYNIKNLKDKEIPLLRRKLGVVFQDFKLLPDRTIYDNLAFVLKATGWTQKQNLDPETSREIMQLFKELHKGGISIIMATHDYNMIVKFPGKIYQCTEGVIQEVVAKSEA
ncbi:MAG: ATP-binding cassette domain-containing protein [Flavobacteriia bacterium]|nr:ATP-binding cassette domain-containing protein [Flavobacteriia bacterium]